MRLLASGANVCRHHHHSSLARFGVLRVRSLALGIASFVLILVFLFILPSIGSKGLPSVEANRSLKFPEVAIVIGTLG